MSNSDLETLVGHSAAVMAALGSGLLRALYDAPVSVETASTQLGLDHRAVARLLEVLESMGVAAREAGGFRMAPRHREVVPQIPASLEGMDRLWSQLPRYLVEGKALLVQPTAAKRGPVYSKVVDQLATLFAKGAENLAASLDAPCRRVLDVGAGSGVWTLAMAARDPSLQVVALDRPEVLPCFLERARSLGLEERVELIEADYHQVRWRELEFDRVVLANVLHLEHEAEAAALVRGAASALTPGGQLVTVDAFPSDALEQRQSYDLYRLHLAMRTGGRRAHAEGRIRDWYREAGLEAAPLLRVDPARPELGALVAVTP